MITEQTYAITLETLSPLHIGGRDNPLTGMENAVAQVGEALVVPGPSLKGALRHQVELYLIAQYYDTSARSWRREHLAMQPCMAGAGAVSPEEQELVAASKYRRTGGGNRYSGCAYGRDDRRDGSSQQSICPVCYLLGAQGLTGFVQIPFLKVERSADALYSGRMDRATSTIAKSTNRPYELVREGVSFTGVLRVLMRDDVRNWEFAQPRQLLSQGTPDEWLRSHEWDEGRILNELVITRLEAIQVIGGYRSKGFGRVKVTVAKT